MTNNQIFRALLASAPILCASCGAAYKNPPKDPAKTALLKSESKRSGLYTWSNYVVQAVDNKPINYSLSWTTESKDIVITSGKHDLVLEGSFNQGFLLGGPYYGRGDLSINASAGRTYRANGEVQGSKIHIWIEDADSHKQVTETLAIPYQNIPQSAPIPIFIPAG